MTYPVILAIDYGTVRIGLAISRGSLAEPLTIFTNDQTSFSKIETILSQQNVARIIVGLSENEMAEKTQAFVEELKRHTNIPIELVDETLSSHTVHQKVLESGMKQSQRQQPIDHLAAAEFLQEYLDSHS
jgi:putative transcription antitermination factor YqgF